MTHRTAAKLPRHWAQINEASFIAGIKLLFIIFRLLGRWPFRLVLYPVVSFYVLKSRAARAASRSYLQRIWPAQGRPAQQVRLGHVIQHFIAFAEAILDKLRVWGGQLPPEYVTIHNREVLFKQLATGQGGVIITAHIGNVELCRMMSQRNHQVKLTVLVHTKHAAAFNRLLAELNPNSQLNLLQVTDMTPDMAMRLSERVQRGEFVVIAADRVPVSPNPRVAYADFLGARAPFPIGPYVLANALQCPVYLVVGLARQGRYHIHFELFSEQIKLPRGQREQALATQAQHYAERLEHYCRLAPLQWFNFYDFWAMPQSVTTHDHP
ncbi:putative LPLAT superfamily acyltransferase [Chitinivorax tropicus]|uniref:Putative LPLAT superfamily acyltransferase n=1 Tax=Chitinivorax tropicus TaxID=714531 RepID=A0A840MGB2_9PROT|nr:acyltransferase [Chitinivorax tropicus]MBB5017440.1 putative LPLAT superfamily acyltransferase [Chitinivorax tropicus]